MESYSWLLPLLICMILLIQQRKRRMAAIRHVLDRKKRSKENSPLTALAKRFIGKECIIHTVMSMDSGIQGTIREVSDGGILVEKKDGVEAVNLEYVTRIREWPRNAKGKKKQIFT